MSARDPSSVVVDLWWDGEDLNIVTADGKHTVYEGAYAVDVSYAHTDISIETKEIAFVRHDFTLDVEDK